MPRILTTCPTTGKPVPTGYRAADLDLSTLEGPWSFRCVECQKIHSWTPKDARLEEVEPRAA